MFANAFRRGARAFASFAQKAKAPRYRLFSSSLLGLGGFAYFGGYRSSDKSRRSRKDSKGKAKQALPNTGLDVPEHSMPEPRPDLPTFSLEEVRKHSTPESAWTCFKGAVYDITDFLGGHPGGRPRLMMAAGGDLAAYWEVYPEQHLRGHVVPFMDKKLRIGNLSPSDAAKIEKEVKFDSYYVDDPERHPDLLANTHHPFNGEPRHHLLTENYYTPNELFYVRLHLNVPDIEPEEYTLTVKGLGMKEKTYTLDDLKTKFPKAEIVNTMQCAGNRREDFHDGERYIYIGPHWVSSAFSNAKWGGVRLRDVLADAGLDVDGIALDKVKTEAKHVQFESYDATETGLLYGASIPIEKAVDPRGDVLLAFEMNGEDLPRDHGYPVRALVPGHAGARSAKFIKEVNVAQGESQKPWQIHAYRGFAPDITFEENLWKWTKDPKVDLNKAQIVQQLPVQSLPCNPPPQSVVGGTPDKVTVKGVAHGWGRGIARVDVSIDDGNTWTAADLYKPPEVLEKESFNREWAWTFFSKDFELNEEQKEVLRKGDILELNVASKAADRAFNVQPEYPQSYYNARGVCINHVYRYPIYIDPKAPEGVHVKMTGEGAYDGFGNVPTGGRFKQAWKVGPYKKDDWHSPEDLFNKEKDTSKVEVNK